ncbi:MAG TPA: hypothetical protein VE422_10515 [Terriglobia bacterium]|nr:hypothetical protein [Terriglobia bacterium]
MKKKLVLLFLGGSLCTYLGYFSLQAQREQNAAAGPAVNEKRAPAPVRGKVANQTRNRVASAEPVKGQNTVRENNVKATDQPNQKSTEMKVVNSLGTKPELSSRLKPLLPARTTLTDAAAGFKNQGQFIAALHVSKNLGVPFSLVKSRMTGEKHLSLVDAVRELRPDLEKKEAKAEVKKAEGQAKLDENQAKAEAKLIASGRS